MTKYLTREEILAVDDAIIEEVEVPQWGGTVRVQGLTAKQRGAFLASIVDQRKGGNQVRVQDVQIRLCGLSMVDASGRRLFSDSDLSRLAAKSSAALEIVNEVAQRLSGLSDEQVEELQSSFDETPSDDSLSD